VAELQPYGDQIDAKYQFLLAAPVKDPQGLLTVIRYSRKTKEQYVRSEKEGKPSGWSAYYNNGVWQGASTGKATK
jgi:DNA topoisomerase-1